MKVFVTGVNGQLGYEVMKELIEKGFDAIGSDLQETSEFSDYFQLDLTNDNQVTKIISETKPDAVIHCAGWTAVDSGEDNKDLVFKINAFATQNLANACKNVDAKMMYISTDYVYDGSGNQPRDPDDKNFHPLNVYGESKLLGEKFTSEILKKYFVVRTSWVFGEHGNNFVKTMLNLANKGFKELTIVNDQIGSPTYAKDLAKTIVEIIKSEKYGFYNITNEGPFVSWADFAKTIFEISGDQINIKGVSTSTYNSKALRPLNSRMSKEKLSINGFSRLPNWIDSVKEYFGNIKGTIYGSGK